MGCPKKIEDEKIHIHCLDAAVSHLKKEKFCKVLQKIQKKKELFMTKKIELITDNLVNEQQEGQHLFKVDTPIAMSLIGNYPILDEQGQLYNLNENQMATYIDGYGDVVPFQIGNKAFLAQGSEYEFIVSENKETAFLDLVMSFKVYAKNEQEAMQTLADLIADNGQVLDFMMSDLTNKQKYDVDILMYTISDLYKAIEFKEEEYAH